MTSVLFGEAGGKEIATVTQGEDGNSGVVSCSPNTTEAISKMAASSFAETCTVIAAANTALTFRMALRLCGWLGQLLSQTQGIRELSIAVARVQRSSAQSIPLVYF